MAAIAGVCSVPFRIIDEFDVFQVCRCHCRNVVESPPASTYFAWGVVQDENNRKFSMDTLTELAKEPDAQGRYAQYMLLTPHDISAAIVPVPGEVEVRPWAPTHVGARSLAHTMPMHDASRADHAAEGAQALCSRSGGRGGRRRVRALRVAWTPC